MKYIKRAAIAMLLALLLMLVFTACAKTETQDAKNTPQTEDGPQSSDDLGDAPNEADTAAKEEEPRIMPDLPDMDFGGFVFKIITTDYISERIMPQEIWAEQETGDPINDAIYKRNKKIEERYNIAITEILHARDEMNVPVKKSVLAADNAYDLICTNIKQGGIMAQRGELHDLSKVNHIDLTKPWYDQNGTADLSVGRKVYFAVGDLQSSNKDGTWVILFNKKLIQDLGLSDPYTLVNEGRWTMDKMFEYAASACKDLDGDGKMDETDQWGMLGEGFNIYALMNGAGTRLVEKDENDIPYYAGYTARDVDIFEKGAEYLGDKDRSMLAENYSSKYTNVWNELINPIFATDRILFFFTSLSRVTWHRDYGTDFGILPTPKYEEAQANYVNTVSVWMACAYSAAVTLEGGDLDRSAIVAEALSAESKYTLIPAYYDIQLKTKLARDNESSQMLDMIFANRTYSLVQLYDWGGLLSTITQQLTAKNRTFVSSMDKIQNKIAGDIEKTVNAFDKVN